MSAGAPGPPIVRWVMLPADRVPHGDGWLSEAERAVQARLRFEARRRDWRLGRWAAKTALRRWPQSGFGGERPEVISILAAEDGAPEVYHAGARRDLALSLSHRGGWALAAVASAGVELGCDLEVVEPRSPAFVRDYFTCGEQRLLRDAAAPQRDRLANLLWSAKESAVKAQRSGWRVDARTADVRLRLDDPGRGWRPLRVDRVGAPSLHGWWREETRLLATVVAHPAPERPVLLLSARWRARARREPARSA